MAKRRNFKSESSIKARARKALDRNADKHDPNERAKDLKGTIDKVKTVFSAEKWGFIIIAIASAGTAVFSIFGPNQLGNMISEMQLQVKSKIAGEGYDLSGVWKLLALIVVIYVISCIATYIQQYTVAGLSQRIVFKLRGDVNEKLSKLPLKYFDSSTKGDVLSRIINDMDNISRNLQNSITQLISALVTIVGVMIMMFITNFTLALITVLALPLCTFIAAFVTKRSQKYFSKQWEQTGEINGHIEEMFTAHKLIKVFNRQEKSIEEFEDINDDLRRSTQRALTMSGVIMPLNDAVNNIVFVLICVIGGVLSISGTINVGDITAFLVYSKLFTHPIQTISGTINQLQSALASFERVFNLLEEEELVPDTVNTTLGEVKGKVEFRNVRFRYHEDKPLIENFNLVVEPGQTVAIVGPTGAGKTTLVNLLMRFYELRGGEILVDDVNITDISREELRETFGMVLQETWLFSGTIRENIAYGKIGATNDEIIEAAKAARANHFIKTLSEGYDTVLEEDGSNVSQGQKQLLTIARAILANPKILILDEATSSVDTRTEVQIQKAMLEMMKDRTSFVIAHRLSTIRDAHTILVMNNGNIVETGNHEQLLAKKGFYYELYNAQFTGADTQEEEYEE
ncbi:MAG: ABC transporter ATP-binding protein [Clostridia bacterium]|nr:ABC transporter ATP-binding protein [Clostridia bacterium]